MELSETQQQDLAFVEALIDLMRKKGVESLRLAEIDVKLGADPTIQRQPRNEERVKEDANRVLFAAAGVQPAPRQPR